MPKKNKIDVLKIIRKQTINQNIFQYQTMNLAANAKVLLNSASTPNNTNKCELGACLNGRG